jgi:hypothetical protein
MYASQLAKWGGFRLVACRRPAIREESVAKARIINLVEGLCSDLELRHLKFRNTQVPA